MKIIKLKEYKNAIKVKIVHKDLADVLIAYNVFVKQIEKYSKYSPIAETLPKVKENKKLIESYIKKFEKILEEYE